MHISPTLRALILSITLLLVALPLSAQQPELDEINQTRLKLNKINMFVLTGWAAGNILVGGIGRSQTMGTTRYFHEMNMFWNVVNLGLAAGGLYGVYTTDPSGMDLWTTLAEQDKLERILLFNLALNFTYMTAGGYLIERSRRTDGNSERNLGYGRSLILQGGFLLLFDTSQYLLHHFSNNESLKQVVQGLSVSANGVGLQFQF